MTIGQGIFTIGTDRKEVQMRFRFAYCGFGWRIQEAVGNGYYIEWPELFATRDGAQAELDRRRCE